MHKVKFFKHDTMADIREPHYDGDVGYDVVAVESKLIWPLFPKTIDTGLALEMPLEIYCTIETRSGHGVKRNLRCHRGIIDSGYRGRISIKVYNHGLLPYRVKVGEKVAQITFHETVRPTIKQTFKIEETIRGSKGFGSSNI